MPFTLRDVPASMRREGWTVGARLMDRWLSGQAYTMDTRVKTGAIPPSATAIDTQAVTMAWALRFARAAAANARLITTWSNAQRLPASSRQIELQLRRSIGEHRTDTSKSFRFGNLGLPVTEVNRNCAINVEVISSNWYGGVDDLYAALGNALVKVAVSGVVEREGSAWQVTIDQLATFIRDTYDFIGDQSLGSWGPKGFSRAAVLAPNIEIEPSKPEGFFTEGALYFLVSNDSFNRYRARFGRGGDFVVFSDLRHVRLARPVVVTVPV